MERKSIDDVAREIGEGGAPRDYGPDNSRLLIALWRELALGRPVTPERLARTVSELGMALDAADEFLRGSSERDAEDNIVGLVGLSLNEHWAHRFRVDGVSLRTWCAWDSLFLPPLLGRTATIESESPVTGETVRLTVSPERVEDVEPHGSVVSIVIMDGEDSRGRTMQGSWDSF